jgi:hypothetical protein
MTLSAAPPASPATAGEALAMARAGLAFLAHADAGSLTAAELAEYLRELARAESAHTAARGVRGSAAPGSPHNDSRPPVPPHPATRWPRPRWPLRPAS